MGVTDLERAVDRVLRSLEPGDVMTYGEVAVEAGFPGRARAVGHILARSGGEYPWWRVCAAGGRLAPGKERDQTRRLRAEGVEVDERGVTALRKATAAGRRSGRRPGARPPR